MEVLSTNAPNEVRRTHLWRTPAELPGRKPPKVAPVEEDSATRPYRKRFQIIATLPERAQKQAVADCGFTREQIRDAQKNAAARAARRA